jgi:methyl-accepting chemotaxis protein
MQNLNQLKLKTRIYLGYLIPIILFTILGGATYLTLAQNTERQEEYHHVVKVSKKVSDVNYAISKIVRTIRGYALDPTTSRLQVSKTNYEEGIQEYQTALSELDPLVLESERSKELKTLLVESDNVLKAYSGAFDLMQAGQVAKGVDIIKNGTLRPIEEVRSKLRADEQASEERLEASERNTSSILTLLVILGTVLTAVSSATIGWFVVSWSTTKIQQATGNITSSSNELVATVEEQERIARQQATAVNETITTMSELEASCQQSTEQAQAAVVTARHTLELVTQGSQAVGQTKEGMLMLQQKVEAIAEQIVHLSAQANQIDSISEVVSELANRTNMLALNSSVEATRAGEHGKGFTIVANEIRKLADQSQQSADRISTLVADIQKAVNSTVMVTDEGTKTVRQGMQIAQNTEQAFAGVKESIDQVALNNQQVSLNIKQQFDAIQQVVQAMESLNKGASETAIGLTQTKTGTAHLNQAALVLQKMV